jgi:hypothetical protein
MDKTQLNGLYIIKECNSSKSPVSKFYKIMAPTSYTKTILLVYKMACQRTLKTVKKNISKI